MRIAFLFAFNFIFLVACRSYDGNDDIFIDGIVDNSVIEAYEQRTVLTLGGMWITEEIRKEVIAFNHENQHYQIIIKDYAFNEDDLSSALNLFHVEMTTGRGPDILVNAGLRDINPVYLSDLYSFIDADPELNRTDFFPNVLKIMETRNGSLPFFSNTFGIRTIITLKDNAALFDPFTFNSLLKQLEESGSGNSLGGEFWMTRSFFMTTAINLSGDYFLDYANNRANLNNEEFINVLEIAARIPDPQDLVMWNLIEEWIRLLNGEQLLHLVYLDYLQAYRELKAILGDIAAIGMPTHEGGQHIISLHGELAINAGSAHQEAAWSFVRRFLLPDFDPGYGLPLRMDVFESRITELMTPDFWTETNPEIGAVAGEERPTELWWGGSVPVYIFAMTEKEAEAIREIVYNARMSHHFNETIAAIVEENSKDFFNGIRSAEDTARIMQNRIQTFLNEQR